MMPPKTRGQGPSHGGFEYQKIFYLGSASFFSSGTGTAVFWGFFLIFLLLKLKGEEKGDSHIKARPTGLCGIMGLSMGGWNS